MADDDLFPGPAGATPIDPDTAEGLIPTWIALRRDLDEAEQANVAAGFIWAQRARGDVLSEDFCCRLHQRMFGNVWRWAGTFRKTETSIGVAPTQIAMELRLALDDARFWIDQATYSVDEIAVRLHHRTVLVHPFPNGNGRWSRLLADTQADRLGRPPFTWGGRDETLQADGRRRQRYLDALRAADDHDIGPLLSFARER